MDENNDTAPSAQDADPAPAGSAPAERGPAEAGPAGDAPADDAPDQRPGAEHAGASGTRPAGRRREVPLWARLAASGTALALMVAGLSWVPVPYVVESPGPTFNVLGSDSGTPMISISGTDPASGADVAVDAPQSSSYAAKAPSGDGGPGQLRMVTVAESGGPGRRLNLLQLVGATFDSRSRILDYDSVYPPTATQEQVDNANQAQMQSSQSTSQVAALEYLGWRVPASVTIEGGVEGTDAAGKVAKGDALTAITTADGAVHPVDSASAPFAIMSRVPVGDTVVLSVQREGNALEIPVTTVAGEEGSEGSKLGVYLSIDAQLPLDISFNLENVGGPSAGMMFSLGIIDRLTPGDMTGGAVIAGTGTMNYDGRVGAIGGIQQKMWGAKEDGAQWFFAPAANCDEVVGNVPDGLRVVRVATLGEAADAVHAIAQGDGASLPICTAR